MSKIWSYNPKPAKLSVSDKGKIEAIIRQFISKSFRLSQIVHRTEIRAGRIYLFRLYEQFGWDNPELQFKKPLIDGKYVEFPLARITLFNTLGEKCSVDWQRHTGQWMNLHQGNITECLAYIEQDEEWFS